jgi:hypothetical protein
MGHRKSNVDVFIAVYLTDWNAPTFKGQPHEDARMWLRKIRTGLKLHAVPPALWVPIAFHFLGDEPRVVLDGVQRMMAEREVQEGRGEWEWEWDRFTRALM